MTPEDTLWDGLIDGLRRGDAEVEHRFWQRYGPQLEQMAQRKLGGPLRRRVDPQDIAQSVCRTFLRRAQLGEFELEDSRSLWRLLCAITLNKIRGKARFHGRKKRSLQQEQSLARPVGSASSPGWDPSATAPSPDEIAEFVDQFEHILGSLDEEERSIVSMKLTQQTNAEIATALGRSERTVRRLLARTEKRFLRELVGEGA